jgi:hypothetical protein
MENKFQKYQKLHYRYLSSRDVWEILFDTGVGMHLYTFYSTRFRLDQCLDIVNMELKSLNNMAKQYENDLLWGYNTLPLQK